ncbi:glutathione S-transferase [Trichoderma barbatum]
MNLLSDFAMAARSTTSILHYLDIGRMGRGEVVNLFLKDAGIEYQDLRYPYDGTWHETSTELNRKGLTRTGKLPALEFKGAILNQHIPTLRYLARDLGRYDGETSWEKYIVDAVSDIYIDWRFKWVANLGKSTEEYKDDVVPKYYDVLAQYYAETEGPYLLGDKITYADFAVYQSIDNDQRTGTLPPKLPDSISKFRETFEQRPSIAQYIRENFPKA